MSTPQPRAEDRRIKRIVKPERDRIVGRRAPVREKKTLANISKDCYQEGKAMIKYCEMSIGRSSTDGISDRHETTGTLRA